MATAAAAAAAAPAPAPLVADAITQRLVAEGRAASTWGLNANLFDMEMEPLRAPYAALAAAMTEEFAAVGLDESVVYVYPFEHLHITAASPAPFTHTTLATAEARAAFEAAYVAAARETCSAAVAGSEGEWPAAPFEVLVGAELRLDAACGILLCGDAAGAVPRVRRRLAACMRHAAVAALGEAAAAAAAFKHPSIVHMSFLRFLRAPGAAAAAAGGDAAVRAAFARAAARAWPAPVAVRADALYLVRELRPYMHLRVGPRGGPPGEDAACVVARLPYGAAEAEAEA